MNILITVDRYFPEPSSAAVMLKDLTEELRDQGHKICVLTGNKDLTNSYERVYEENIAIFKIKTPDLQKISLARRLIFEIYFERKLWQIFRNDIESSPVDLIISYSPTIFWSFLIRKIKKRFSAKSYLIVRDIFPKWAVDTKIISHWNPVYWFLRAKENSLYEITDFIGVQSNSNLEYFKNHSFSGNFIAEVLFNWKKINPDIRKNSDIRSKLGLKEKVIFVYGGNFGFAQDMDNLLRLFKSLACEELIHFLMVGGGSESNKVKSWIKANNLGHKITIISSLPDHEYNSVLKECDVGIISLRKDFKMDNFPGKMLGYMENKLAILASVNPGNEIKDIIEHNKAGFVCDNGEDKEFSRKAIQLISNNAQRKQMGDNGHALLLTRFNVESAAKQILKHIECLKT